MSSSKEMTFERLPKYWDALVKQVKEHEGRLAQLEAKNQAPLPVEKEVEPE